MEHVAKPPRKMPGAYKARKRPTGGHQKKQRGGKAIGDHRRYLQTRNVRKQRQRIRYKVTKKHPARTRGIRRRKRNPALYRRRGIRASSDLGRPPGVDFFMRCDEQMEMGWVTAVIAEYREVEYELDTGETGSMDVNDFLDCITFGDEQDIEVFFDILDQAAEIALNDPDPENVTVFELDPSEERVEDSIEDLGETGLQLSAFVAELAHPENIEVPEDLKPLLERAVAATMSPSPERVAFFYTGFNKENAPDLLNQLVKVLDKNAQNAEGPGRKGLQDASSRVKGMTKAVSTAWLKRNDE